MVRAKGPAFVLACMLVASPAFAEESDPQAPSANSLNKTFRVALSLDRVLFLGPFTQEGSRGESGIAVAAASFVKSSAIDDTGEPFVPHAIARLGVDIALPWGLTVGIAGGHGVVMGTPDNGSSSARSVVSEDPAIATTVLQARFGYMHPLEGSAFFWFRTGFAYSFATDENTSSPGYGSRLSIHHVSVPIDFVFVFPFAKHFGITYGLSADLGLYGVDARASYGIDIPSETSETRRVNDGVGMWFGVLGLL